MLKNYKHRINIQLFGMPNPDQLSLQKAEIMNQIQKAMKDGDEEGFQEAFTSWTEMVQNAVMQEARGLVQSSDNQILQGRGQRVLTSEETKYYQKLAEAMKSTNPKQALEDMDVVMPETVIDTVFEDITEQHPLLGVINFQNAGALVEWLYSTQDGRHMAKWGKLTAAAVKELSAGFDSMKLNQTSLIAFVPVARAMLDLGPVWLDRFIRAMLYEGIANGLEYGVIQGRGIAEGAADADDKIYEPIGMVRDLENFNITNGYAKKDPIEVTEFTPVAYGQLAAKLAVNRNGLPRPVNQVLLVVNPVDYLTKVMPATVYLTPSGAYARDIFPIPTTVVQSAHVEQNEAVFGLADRYVAVVGPGTNGGRIEQSDHALFFERERAYIIELYGNGKPKDNTSFVVLDIENLTPLLPKVQLEEAVPEV